jgi:hypothetical protein
MRIDYTLPALQPGTLLDAEELQGGSRPTFRDRLRGAPVSFPLAVERVLHLDAAPLNASFIGPPPRPQSLDTSDANSERVRWRNMLLSHLQSVRTPGTQLDARGAQAVQTMLGMLLQTLRMEEVIASRSAAVTRG